MMKLRLEDVKLSMYSPAMVGAAIKIQQAGGSSLTLDQMRRAAGSAFLMKQHQDDILNLVKQLEAATEYKFDWLNKAENRDKPGEYGPQESTLQQ